MKASRDLSQTTGARSPKSAAPRYTASNGYVLDRGSPLHPSYPPVLLAVWRREALAGDYFAPTARTYAAELEAAMRAAGMIEPEGIAA